MKKYKVIIDDNYHYMDESERHAGGEYATQEEAVAECKRIVEGFLHTNYELGLKAEELYGKYVTFGQDPWIQDGSGDVPFSAWQYAKERSDEMCARSSSEVIQKAIHFATQVHDIDQKQTRKGKEIPYINHPLSVGKMLALAGADEDTIIAGILHDTMEDSIPEKKVTRQVLIKEFGEKVAEIVVSVTESDKSLPWEKRKEQALEHIPHLTHEGILVKSADVLDNVTELLNDIEHEGAETLKRFNAPLKIVPHARKIIDALLEAFPQSPFAEELRRCEERLAQTPTELSGIVGALNREQLGGSPVVMVPTAGKTLDEMTRDVNAALTQTGMLEEAAANQKKKVRGTVTFIPSMSTKKEFYVEILHPYEKKVLWHYFITAPSEEIARDAGGRKFLEENEATVTLDLAGLYIVTAEEITDANRHLFPSLK